MKNNKFAYYLSNSLLRLIPSYFFRRQLARKLTKLPRNNRNDIEDRVNYYCKVDKPFKLPTDATRIRNFKKTKGWTYFFDLLAVLRYFPKESSFCYINGDVRKVPDHPSFLKSRPVSDNNQNSVILNLNKIRHFLFINDPVSYQDKQDRAVWRGTGYKNHRQVVIKQFYNHPRCNIAQVCPIKGDPWEGSFLSIREQLNYKFILCIEGNDVATNLKWAMSSNSVCVMSRPKFETWFMEGRLQAGVHYVEVKDDYSDLVEKMDYYLAHENEAINIIYNANMHTKRFIDKNRENIISYLVADKYFKFNNP